MQIRSIPAPLNKDSFGTEPQMRNDVLEGMIMSGRGCGWSSRERRETRRGELRLCPDNQARQSPGA
jgi:hypothetical protein